MVITEITSKHLIDNVGTLNPIQDVVDKSVIETGNWFIYGSRKTNLEPYLLTMEIDYDGTELDISRWNLLELVKSLSIRKDINNKNYINVELERDIKEKTLYKI